jgi:hypothetical protein
MQILKGHISPDTAYVVDDYPYGFRLRCKIRYWIEYKPKLGFRLCSQTTNPKRGNVWNKPKASIYANIAGAMYLDENSHVQFAALSGYANGKESAEWLATYGDGIPDAGAAIAKKWIAAKIAYDANRNSGDALTVGLKEAREAFKNG